MQAGGLINISGLNIIDMKELINKLMAEGLTEQQANKAIEVIKEYAKQKVPMFAGAINKVFDKYSQKDEDDILG